MTPSSYFTLDSGWPFCVKFFRAQAHFPAYLPVHVFAAIVPSASSLEPVASGAGAATTHDVTNSN